MDTREVRFDIANGLVLRNASLPSLTDWSRGRPIYHSIHSIIPINENDSAPPSPLELPPKHLAPNSMDWREVRFDIANDPVIRNASSPSLTDWSRGRSISHFIHSIIPISENDDAPLKQFWPNSMDWREVRFDIANDLVLRNASLPSLTDWSRGRSITYVTDSTIPINENDVDLEKHLSLISTASSASDVVILNDFADLKASLVLNDLNDFISKVPYKYYTDTLYHNRGSIVESITPKWHRSKGRKICNQSHSPFPPCRVNGAW